MRTVDLLGELADDDRACRIREALELLEMFVDVMAGGSSLERRADENRPFGGRRQLDEVA